MSASLCSNPPCVNPHPHHGLVERLAALWQQFQQAGQRQRQAEALQGLSAAALCDINAPDWLRRDVLHQAELEQYDRMRTLAHFRGFM